MSFRNLLQQNLFWRGWFYLSLFLLNIVIARAYGAGISGKLFFTINSLQLILLITSFSLQSGILYYSSKEKNHQPFLSILSLAWPFAASLAAMGIIYFFFPGLSELSTQDLFLQQVFPYVAGTMLVTFFSALIMSNDDYRSGNLFPALINLFLILVVPLHGNPLSVSRELYIHLFFYSYLLQGLSLAFFYFIKSNRGPFNWNSSLMKNVFRYSAIALISNLAYYLLYRVDYFFVEYFCDAKALGNYIQVSKFGQLFLMIPSTMAAVILPMVAKGNALYEPLKLMGKALFFLWLIILLVLVIAGKSIFSFLMGPSFNDMQLPLIYLFPGIYFLSQVTLLSAYFGGKGMLRLPLMANLIAIVIMVITDLLFIPSMGIKGAAIACSISYGVNLTILYYYFYRKTGIGWMEYFVPSKKDVRAVIPLLNGFKF